MSCLQTFRMLHPEVTLDVYSEISLVSQGAGYREEDDTFLIGGCSAWTSFWKGGDLELHSLVMRAKSLVVAKQSRSSISSNGSSTRDTLDDFHEVLNLTCSSTSSIERIVAQITQNSSDIE